MRLRLWCFAVPAYGAAAPSFVQNVPDKRITRYVGFGPGGPADLAFRALAEAASRHLGQRVIVANNPGVCATTLLRAKGDGHTISHLSPTLTRMPHLTKVDYDPLTVWHWPLGTLGTSIATVVGASVTFYSIFSVYFVGRASLHVSMRSVGTNSVPTRVGARHTLAAALKYLGSNHQGVVMLIRKLYNYLILFSFLFIAHSGAWAQIAAPGKAAATGATQPYPTKTVRVIIPGATGDTCDTMLRMIGQKFLEKYGYAFVMDNRPGAVGQVGLTHIAQAPTDGYTIGCGQGGNMVIVPLAYKKVAYDSTKDFAPIALMASNYLALTVHPTSPHKTARDLIAFAKANPGKIAFGTNGEGAFLHFATELLRKVAGFTYYHVPFRNAQLMVTDLLGARIDAVLGAFITVQPHAVNGRLRILGVARETRAPNYPQFPTLSEAGVPGFTSGGWFGAIGPAGMPTHIVALLNKEMNAAMALPEIREKAAMLGLDLHTEPPAFFAKTIRDDFDKWGKLAREVNFKPQ